jgi:diguanylate cyclase (GGDEF)-like protein
MPDLINIKKGTGVYIKEKIYVYHDELDWFIGLDNPIVVQASIPHFCHTFLRILFIGLDSPARHKANKINEITHRKISVAYPLYFALSKLEFVGDERDALTGLLSRKRFYNDLTAHLKTVSATDLNLFIFYIDFNNFKVVNDILGHNMGDRVLVSLSGEIRNIFSGYGNSYRLGGDEFAGLSLGITAETADVLKKRIEKVSEQAPCGLFVNLSVGVKKITDINTQVSTKEIDVLLAEVEGAMYKHKELKQSVSINCKKCPYSQK